MTTESATPVPTVHTVDVSELLFDMDGTLVNSIPAVEHAWREWASEEGVELPETLSFHGRTARDLVGSFVAADRVDGAVDRLNELESTSTEPIPTTPGALDLIASLPRERWAVVTSAALPVAKARLAAGRIPMPEHLITGDAVVNGKPDPEPFHKGQRNEGTAIAFEDTVAGLRSARGAGCITVAIVGTMQADDLRDFADYVVPDLTSVTVVAAGESGLTLRIEAI